MLYSPPSNRPTTAARTGFGAAFRAIVTWFAAQRRRRVQRIALRDLMQFDAALLDDLGIDRIDVMEALERSDAEAARMLERRSARNAARRPGHP